ncbi:MAG: ChaN family lipoprotein, partial [Acidobacteriota bacterium]
MSALDRSLAAAVALAALLLPALNAPPARAVEEPAEAAADTPDAPDLLHLAIGAPDRRDRTVDLVVDGVVDTGSGDVLTPAGVAGRLAGTRLVFFGEHHTSMEMHRAQLRLLQELEATGRPLLIGLEMFPYTAQEGLDRWVDGLLTERGFLEIGGWYEHWGLHWGYYRDVFRFARDHGVPMLGVNTP